MKCKFCHNEFSNKQNLNYHQKKARYCLKIQGVEIPKKYECNGCNKTFEISANFERHKKICKNPNKIQEYEEIFKQMNEDMSKLRETIKVIQKENEMLREQLNKSQESYDNAFLTAVSGNFENETTIEINEDDIISDNDFTIEETEDDGEDEYKLQPLDVDKGFTIEHREEDGYINVTNLCKAGGKQFKAWNRLEKTKAFLRVLSRSVLINTDLLIKTQTGGGIMKTEVLGYIHRLLLI